MLKLRISFCVGKRMRCFSSGCSAKVNDKRKQQKGKHQTATSGQSVASIPLSLCPLSCSPGSEVGGVSFQPKGQRKQTFETSWMLIMHDFCDSLSPCKTAWYNKWNSYSLHGLFCFAVAQESFYREVQRKKNNPIHPDEDSSGIKYEANMVCDLIRLPLCVWMRKKLESGVRNQIFLERQELLRVQPKDTWFKWTCFLHSNPDQQCSGFPHAVKFNSVSCSSCHVCAASNFSPATNASKHKESRGYEAA